MLFALYFNDEETFKCLYRYILNHSFNTKDPETGKRTYLMHWKINKEGKEVSEFEIELPHGIPCLDKRYKTKSLDINRRYESIENLESYCDENYEIYHVEGDDVISVPMNGRSYIFIQSAEWGREAGSATDADVDIAGALVFAWYKWGDDYYSDHGWGLGTPSRTEVENVLKSGLNATYYNTDYSSIYNYYLKLYDVKKKMHSEMEFVNRQIRDGLFPDWCEIYNSGRFKFIKPSTASDRMYWSDKDPVTNEWTTYPNAIFNGNSKYYKKMSYNMYYDAIRVPWGLAVDYSWYGDSKAYKILEEQAFFISDKGH